MRNLIGLLAALWMAISGDAIRAEPPRIVVSIVPVHSLVAGVTAGVTDPVLLISGAGSPHGYYLRPSEMLSIARADAIIWVGQELETVLSRPLKNLTGDARVLTLLDLPTIRKLKVRKPDSWKTARDRAVQHTDGTSAGKILGQFDPHIWLDPTNAMEIVHATAVLLAELDPRNAHSYERNESDTLQRIKDMDLILDAQLSNIREVPFVVLHDAYQYFENRFNLHAVGAIAASAEKPPSVRWLRALRERIFSVGAVCAFREPQMRSALVETLSEDTDLRLGVLDPLGSSYTHGPDAYFETMRANADALTRCLVKWE